MSIQAFSNVWWVRRQRLPAPWAGSRTVAISAAALPCSPRSSLHLCSLICPKSGGTTKAGRTTGASASSPSTSCTPEPTSSCVFATAHRALDRGGRPRYVFRL